MGFEAGTGEDPVELKDARRRRIPAFLTVAAGGLAIVLLLITIGWTYCFFSEAPVRAGKLTVYSLLRKPNHIDYSGQILFEPKNGQRWVVEQKSFTILLDFKVLPDFVSPKIYRLPGLVITAP